MRGKIIQVISIFSLAVIISCSPKLYKPAQVHSEWVTENVGTASVSELLQGRIMYIAACQGCHYLHYPSEFTRGEWEKIFPEMSTRANLNDSTSSLVYSYLLAGAADTKP
ncbi:MAG: hypothetical protein ACKVPJ_11755 [Chitinophagales bacterium]